MSLALLLCIHRFVALRLTECSSIVFDFFPIAVLALSNKKLPTKLAGDAVVDPMPTAARCDKQASCIRPRRLFEWL